MYNLSVNKKIILLVVAVTFCGIALFVVSQYTYINPAGKPSIPPYKVEQSDGDNNTAGGNTNATPDSAIANPASTFCEKNGGQLEFVATKDGGQLGMCNLNTYFCEEWAFYRGECTVDADAAAIRQALINKGLNLTGMKVVIRKHLGNFIEGSVDPVSDFGGGGYVFAAKTVSGMKIVADGNGIISCDSFKDFPEFSTYLVPSCVDKEGNLINR